MATEHGMRYIIMYIICMYTCTWFVLHVFCTTSCGMLDNVYSMLKTHIIPNYHHTFLCNIIGSDTLASTVWDKTMHLYNFGVVMEWGKPTPLRETVRSLHIQPTF